MSKRQDEADRKLGKMMREDAERRANEHVEEMKRRCSAGCGRLKHDPWPCD